MALRGGSFFADRPPAFSNDGKFLLVCTGCTVSVLSVATGLRVAELQGHTDRVTSVVVVQRSDEAMSVLTHAWTSSLDRTIRLWNFMTAKEIEVIDVGFRVVSMVICGASLSSLVDDKSIAFLSVEWDEEVKEVNEVMEMEKAPLPRELETSSSDEEDEWDDDDDDDDDEGDDSGKEEDGVAEKGDGNYLGGDERNLETEENKSEGDQKNAEGDENNSHRDEGKLEGDDTKIKLVETRDGVPGYPGQVILFRLDSKTMVDEFLAKTKVPQKLVKSRTGTFVGMADFYKLWVWKAPTADIDRCSQVQVTVLHPWKPLTAMAFGPTETLVAAGDRKGQITIWKNFGERQFYSSDYFQGKKDTTRADDAESKTVYHWHHKRVECLSFTSDGAYLLSGGKEAVFVMWQLETGEQQFLPRLGSSFRHITNSPDPSLFLLSMADNSLRFLNIASMKMDRVIYGIKRPLGLPNPVKFTNVALHNTHGSVALSAPNLMIQFYDVLRDKHATQIQVSQRNFVSFANTLSGYGESTLVTHFAFSADGSVMSTVDLRAEEAGVGGGSFLKFWESSPGKVPYTIHTSVDSPHSGRISALAYHPSEHVAVTCSIARDFKLWVRTRNDEKNTYTWRCNATGSYKQKIMHAAAFSHDGTLLAVAAGEFITLWNPVSNTILCVLSIPGDGDIRRAFALLSFVPKCPYLVSASVGTRRQLTVWNLSTLSVWWSYKLDVKAIAVDPKGQQFAVLASTKRRRFHNAQVCLFKPESPVPVSVWDFKEGTGGALLFLPSTDEVNEAINSTSSDSKLLVLNKFREYVLFDPSSETDTKPASKVDANAAIGHSFDTLNSFSSLYVTKNTSKRAQRDQISKIKAPQPWGDLLDAPSHTLPPLTDIGQQILERFLQRRTAQ